MPCETFFDESGNIGFVCSRGRKTKPKCYICGRPATKLCDFRSLEICINPNHNGYKGWKTKTKIPSLDTCDNPMCDECSYHIEPDMDFCQEHNSYWHVETTKEANDLHEQRIKK